MSKLEYSFDISDYLVTFVRVAITGVSENVSIPGDFDWEALYILSERHKLSATVWRGIQLVGIQVPDELVEKWYVCAQQVLSRSIRFDNELTQIQTSFDKAGIDYVLLKGVSIQNYWPAKGLREFSDHDILIRAEHRELARDAMLSLGYRNERYGGFHDVYKKEPIYDVEIHLDLFEEEYSYSTFFYDIWNRVLPVPDSSHQFRFSSVDFYLYFLFHFIKHAHCKGVGLRFYADLYVLQERLVFSEEEQRYLTEILSDLDPQHRVQHLYETVDCLFRGKGELLPLTKELIFWGSTYGGNSQRIYNSMQEHGKGYIFYRLFPPRNMLIHKYKILRPLPFLLPFIWIYRLIHHLFTGYLRKRMWKEIREIKRFFGKEVE